MDDLLEEYLDYLQDSAASSPMGFFVTIGIGYALFKQWQKIKEIENGFCKEFKGDPLKLKFCVYQKQMKNSQDIINKLKQNVHTCAQTRRPGRCKEKVRYFIDKYEKKTLDLQKKIEKVKLKIAKKQYKEKIRNIRQQQFHSRMGD